MSLAALGCTPAPSDDGVGDDAEDADETGETGETGETQLVTWHQDIAPIVAEKCGACHREDGIAPFALSDYAQASAWGELALAAIEQNEMPPWGQANTDECQPEHGFLDDPRLSDDELARFAAWIDADMPEGDPATAAPIPGPPSVVLEDADMRLTIPSAIEIGPGADQFWCFVVDPGFTETTFIDGVQVVPGNDRIVHHVLIYIDESGQSVSKAGDDGRYECFGSPGLSNPTLVGAWAPGAPPQVTPEQVAMRVAAGAKLVINVHYHPTGANEVDADTAIDVRLAKGAPLYLGELALIGNIEGSLGGGMGLQPGPNDSGDFPEFRIPAGAVDHTETMIFRLPNSIPELKIWQAGSHMHYVGTDMLIGLQRAAPDPDTGLDKECLVQTPYYDFEWQRGYRYDAPLSAVPTVRPGDMLFMRCNYDNSMGNPHVVEALAEQGLSEPQDVYLGEETLDEMCLGVFGVAYSLLP